MVGEAGHPSEVCWHVLVRMALLLLLLLLRVRVGDALVAA